MGRRGVSTALVLSGLLMLPACGSGNSGKDAAAGVGGVVHVGPYTQVFASPLPASPAQADVVEGFRQAQVLWDKSENARHLVPPVRDWVTGHALTNLTSAIKGNRTHDVVPAGVDRFFKTRVTAITGGKATVATCDDASKFKGQNPRTGKVNVGFIPTPGQAYLSETWRMARLSGHWAITALSVSSLPSRGAEPCQPGMTGYGPSVRPDVTLLLTGMRTTVRAARSVHISGTLQRDGQSLGVNFGMTRSGEFSGQLSEDRTVLSVLSTDGRSYLKVSPGFLRIAHLPAAACHRFCGKYLRYPAARARDLFAHVNMAAVTRAMTGTPAHRVKLFGAVTIAGQLAWLLQDSHEDSLYIAAHGKPYVLRAVGPPPGEDIVNLTQWDAVRIPAPPPASQLVYPGQLAGATRTS